MAKCIRPYLPAFFVPTLQTKVIKRSARRSLRTQFELQSAGVVNCFTAPGARGRGRGRPAHKHFNKDTLKDITSTNGKNQTTYAESRRVYPVITADGAEGAVRGGERPAGAPGQKLAEGGRKRAGERAGERVRFNLVSPFRRSQSCEPALDNRTRRAAAGGGEREARVTRDDVSNHSPFRICRNIGRRVGADRAPVMELARARAALTTLRHKQSRRGEAAAANFQINDFQKIEFVFVDLLSGFERAGRGGVAPCDLTNGSLFTVRAQICMYVLSKKIIRSLRVETLQYILRNDWFGVSRTCRAGGATTETGLAGVSLLLVRGTLRSIVCQCRTERPTKALSNRQHVITFNYRLDRPAVVNTGSGRWYARADTKEMKALLAKVLRPSPPPAARLPSVIFDTALLPTTRAVLRCRLPWSSFQSDSQTFVITM
ncbi:hypothetical protein EVAR_24175_1 [Eumeta japonica]|uniref:Uncharacterized protein n=1 Tax=Eumeta variegata TaxID=151549 RepID=A0A4C1W612_EUMVA|nr:hypothetical protein EVAR_24175_1 [Eumeta japonica]